jgi:hypothetical protein
MEGLNETVFDRSAKKLTVFKDFNAVRTSVTDSNVMMYGDFDVGHMKLSAFLGKQHQNIESTAAVQNMQMVEKTTAVSSRDVGEETIRYQLTNKKLTDLEKHKLTMKLHLNNQMRLIIDSVFQDIYSRVQKLRPDIQEKIGELDDPKHLKLQMDVFPCYRSILNKITESCFSLPRNPYSLKRLKIFANLCVIDKHIHQIVEKIVNEACPNIHKNIDKVF